MDLKNLISKAKPKTKEVEFLPFLNTKVSPATGITSILETAENLKVVLDHYKIEHKFNLMLSKREIKIPGFKYKDDLENQILIRIEDLCKINGMPNTKTDRLLTYLSHDNDYHPIREYIKHGYTGENNNLLNEFCETIPSTNPELTKILVKTWMVTAVAAAFTEEGISAQGVLIFTGKQGTHKTRFVESLTPNHLKAVQTGASLDPNNNDSKFNSLSTWIIELGELDGTFKNSIPALKAHITRSVDTLRLPYARQPTEIKRRTTYIGTVNNTNFLKDDTGNRRFWTIEITDKINLDHGLDMRKIWQEAYKIYIDNDSKQIYLTEKEEKALEKSNVNHEQECPILSKLLDVFNFDGQESYKRENLLMSTTQILDILGYDKPSRTILNQTGSALKSIKPPLLKGSGRNKKSYYMPIFNLSNVGNHR